jgi:uncharacterized membrane protein
MRPEEQAGRRRGYGMLLATLIASYLVSAVVSIRWSAVIQIAFVLAITLLALRTTSLRRPVAILAGSATLASSVVAAGLAASGDSAAQGAASIWTGLMLLLTVVIIVERVLVMDQVNLQSIYAALSAYLLIGLMFATFFTTIGHLGGGPFFADGQPASPQTIQYFSFTTLTTLGYGDFTAAGNLGRALAVMEALTGQVFLATLVARLVSAYGMTRRRDPPPPGD